MASNINRDRLLIYIMICVLDENDYCTRHKHHHKGRSKELALDPGAKGEEFRLAWDRMVSQSARPFPRRQCGCRKSN